MCASPFILLNIMQGGLKGKKEENSLVQRAAGAHGRGVAVSGVAHDLGVRAHVPVPVVAGPGEALAGERHHASRGNARPKVGRIVSPFGLCCWSRLV